MFDLAKGFQKLDGQHKTDRPPGPPKATVEPVTALRVPSTLDPWLDANDRYEEPSNEELGIVPLTGWRLVLVWLASPAVVGLLVWWAL